MLWGRGGRKDLCSHLVLYWLFFVIRYCCSAILNFFDGFEVIVAYGEILSNYVSVSVISACVHLFSFVFIVLCLLLERDKNFLQVSLVLLDEIWSDCFDCCISDYFSQIYVKELWEDLHVWVNFLFQMTEYSFPTLTLHRSTSIHTRMRLTSFFGNPISCNATHNSILHTLSNACLKSMSIW